MILQDVLVSHLLAKSLIGLSSCTPPLGMVTTAEGVETEEQLEILRAEECTQVQGYLFSPPRPVAEIPAILERLQPRVRAA